MRGEKKNLTLFESVDQLSLIVYEQNPNAFGVVLKECGTQMTQNTECRNY